jgi:RNA polymerase sigma-70 factor (ECF subfamily)
MNKKKSMKHIDIKGFEKMFKQYYSDLCYFALKYMESEEDAEEVVQDVFYHLWEKRETIRINISVKSYLLSSVRNKCLQILNHRKVKRKYGKMKSLEPDIHSDSPADDLIYSESMEIFNEALNSLPEKCRTIFKMSRFDGMKYKDIAFELSISVKTVEANISKALKEFRQYFPNYA